MFKNWFAKSARSVPLRAYGKLPFAAEYRRLGCDTGTAAAFTRWLDEGRAALLSRLPQAQLLTSTLCVPFNAGREWVLARIWDSRDSLGRRFPFCFFVVCSQSDLGDGLLERLAAAAFFGRAFEAAWRERGALSGRDFARVYGDFKIDCPPDKAAAETAELRRAAGEWASSAAGRASAAPASVCHSAGVVRAAIHPGSSAEAQAAHALLQTGAAVQAGGSAAWLILNDAPPPGATVAARLTVASAELGPADYEALCVAPVAAGVAE